MHLNSDVNNTVNNDRMPKKNRGFLRGAWERRGRAGTPRGGGGSLVRKGEKNTVKTIYLNTQNAKIFY